MDVAWEVPVTAAPKQLPLPPPPPPLLHSCPSSCHPIYRKASAAKGVEQRGGERTVQGEVAVIEIEVEVETGVEEEEGEAVAARRGTISATAPLPVQSLQKGGGSSMVQRPDPTPPHPQE